MWINEIGLFHEGVHLSYTFVTKIHIVGITCQSLSDRVQPIQPVLP